MHRNMKKTNKLISLAVIGGLVLSLMVSGPALAVAPTPTEVFAEEVLSYTEGQFEEFVRLFGLLRDVENPGDFYTLYLAGYANFDSSEQVRFMHLGKAIDYLTFYTGSAAISDVAMQQYYDDTDTAGLVAALLSEYGDTHIDADIDLAMQDMRTLLNITLIMETFDTAVFYPVSSLYADLTLDSDELLGYMDTYNFYLDPDIDEEENVILAFQELADYVNQDASSADRSLVVSYLEDTGLVVVESSGGGGGAPIEEEPVEEPEVGDENIDAQEEAEEAGAIEVETTVTTEDGVVVATATVSDDDIDQALVNAFAIKDDKEEDDASHNQIVVPTLVIEAIDDTSAERIVVDLPMDKLMQVEEQESIQFAVKSEVGSIVFTVQDILGDDAGGLLTEDGSNQLSLTMEKIDASLYADQNIPEDALIVDFSISVNETVVSTFSNALKVKIPYVLKEGENPDNITVFLIDESGNLVPQGGRYHASTGMVTFYTDHFSSYVAMRSIREFLDVDVDFWGHAYISSMGGKGYMQGYPDGTFKPNGAVTRAEFITMMVNMYCLRGDVSDLPFDDVHAEQWFAPYIAAAYGEGLVSGKTLTIFDPAGAITRQEAAVMLGHMLGHLGFVSDTNQSQLEQFADQEEIALWARPSVDFAVREGLFSGKPNQMFDPHGILTRAEAATTLFMLLNDQ